MAEEIVRDIIKTIRMKKNINLLKYESRLDRATNI